MAEQKLYRTIEAAELAGIQSTDPKNRRYLFMECIKKLGFAPAEEKTREGKGGKPEKFWSMAQIEAVKKLRDTSKLGTASVIPSTPADPTAITLEERANRIRKLQADVQRGIIQIGYELIGAKKEVGHGGWADWLAREFDWTQQTANRFMRVSERFGKLNNVVQFKPSTLQAMLALPEGEEQAFIEEQASNGNPIESQSAREVQKAVKQWNQRKQRKAKQTNDEPISHPNNLEEVNGEYINLTNNAKNESVIDELNAQIVSATNETSSETINDEPNTSSLQRDTLDTIKELACNTVQSAKNLQALRNSIAEILSIVDAELSK